MTNNPASIGTTKLSFSTEEGDKVLSEWTETSQKIEVLETETFVEKVKKIFSKKEEQQEQKEEQALLEIQETYQQQQEELEKEKQKLQAKKQSLEQEKAEFQKQQIAEKNRMETTEVSKLCLQSRSF